MCWLYLHFYQKLLHINAVTTRNQRTGGLTIANLKVNHFHKVSDVEYKQSVYLIFITLHLVIFSAFISVLVVGKPLPISTGIFS